LHRISRLGSRTGPPRRDQRKGRVRPHSKALKDILNDPHSRPYWAKYKLVFLFSRNEWAIAKSDLDFMAKEGKIRESDVPALLERWKS
jgi:hypothetical protein